MFLIFVLSVIPVIIWSFMEPLASRFSDLVTITTSIGQILGLVGMVLFSINLILASRFKFLDKYFKGLDKVYVNHSKIGSVAFSMMLFHPIFLVIRYITISIQDAALFFVPFVNMTITWGIISLTLIIILISFTFYIKLKYDIWKISHKFMTLAFFFTILHILFISSDISRSYFLRYYILILSLLGLFSIFRKILLEKTTLNMFKYKVSNIKSLNNDILEIEMQPSGKKMTFIAGQFAFFSFIGENINSESHPFSISSSYLENNLKITVKNFGDYTSSLMKLHLNDRVLIDGPYGNFSYKNTMSKNQIWIAGGIGITPFFSMAQNIESNYNVTLFYSVKTKEEAVYVKEFEEISQRNSNFKFNLWDTSQMGYIKVDSTFSLTDKLEDKDFFFCGPPVFMESLNGQLVEKGVDINKIHYESFSF